MAERKRGSPSIWRFVVSLSLAAATAMAAPGVAMADTTLGQAAGSGGCNFDAGADAVQTITNTIPYSLPEAGAVTAWTTTAPAAGSF